MSKIEVKNKESGEVVSEGALTGVESDKGALQTALKASAKANVTYIVSWKAVSKDTHKMQGSYEFKYAPKPE
jgi:methionine-rich copper-binding protein CopC